MPTFIMFYIKFFFFYNNESKFLKSPISNFFIMFKFVSRDF